MSRDNQISDGEKALRIFNALNEFIDQHPDEEDAPEMVITQNWAVKFDYGGWRSDSDYVGNSFILMEEDDEGPYFSLGSILSKIPEIQKVLDRQADFCLEEYGAIPSHEDMEFNQVTDNMTTITSLLQSAIDMQELKGWVLEIDTPEEDIYLVKEEMRSPSYGGLILHYDPMKFIKIASNGEMTVDADKVRELSDRIFNSDLTGEFANDDDDEGGDLFRQSLKGLL